MNYTDEESKELHRRASEAVLWGNPINIAIGYLRYEAVRKLSIREFGELCIRNTREDDTTFDRLVDELILKSK